MIIMILNNNSNNFQVSLLSFIGWARWDCGILFEPFLAVLEIYKKLNLTGRFTSDFPLINWSFSF